MTPDAAILANMLKMAEAEHAKYEKAELGGHRDQNWPDWYADFIANNWPEHDEQATASMVSQIARLTPYMIDVSDNDLEDAIATLNRLIEQARAIVNSRK